ncbi:hypothetical protein BDR26DRAFT_855428 [Obelidium mucronatum]|nr:hypothetical protein BDR26DRAFT_855428 [Obelidium mucronatum]
MMAATNHSRSADPWSLTTQSHSKESVISSSSNATYSEISGSTSFDAQATIHVQEMLEKLESFLFRESPSLTGNTQLSEECEEWSHFFPHIRIRGINQAPQKDQGYDIIPRTKARACSPYLYVPPNPSRAFRMEGIKIPKEAIVRKNPPLITTSNEISTIQEQSLFAWETCGDFNAPSHPHQKTHIRIATKLRLRLPSSIPISIAATSASSSSNAMTGLEALRSGLSDLVQEIGSLSASSFGLALVPSSSFNGGSDDKYIQRSATLQLKQSMSSDLSLVFVHWKSGLTASSGEDRNFEDVEERGIDRMCVYDILAIFKDTEFSIFEVHSQSLSNFLSSQPIGLDVYLVYDATDLPEIVNCEEIFSIDGEVEEYFAQDDLEDSTSDPIPPSRHAYSIRKRGLPPVTPNASIRQDIMSHFFDDLWSEVIPLFHPLLSRYEDDHSSRPTTTTPTPHKKPRHPQLPQQRFPQTRGIGKRNSADINNFSNYFSDEDDDSITDENHMNNNNFSSDDEYDDSLARGKLLSSAMTIKSVPLQKRESSAAVTRRSIDSIASVEAGVAAMVYGSRPGSARPVSSGRLVSVVQNGGGGTRPASGRGLDMYQQALHGSNATGRLQSAASGSGAGGGNPKTARSAAVRRSSTGMRLTPFSAMPPIGGSASISMNDVLFGTRYSRPLFPSESIQSATRRMGMEILSSFILSDFFIPSEANNGRPSTSHGIPSSSTNSASSKRLPPIRMSHSMAHQQELDAIENVALSTLSRANNHNSSSALTQSPKNVSY